MYQLVLIMHIIAAACIIVLVLVQQGKGATLGASFGAGASQTIFGSRGAGSFLLKLTLSFGLIFFMTSLGLNWLSSHAVKNEQAQSVQLPMGLLTPDPVSSPTSTSSPATDAIPSIPALTPTDVKSAAPLAAMALPAVQSEKKSGIVAPIKVKSSAVSASETRKKTKKSVKEKKSTSTKEVH